MLTNRIARFFFYSYFLFYIIVHGIGGVGGSVCRGKTEQFDYEEINVLFND